MLSSDFFNNIYTQNIISGIIGGLIVFAVQVIREYYLSKKQKNRNKIVGLKELKILDQDFIYRYDPERISYAKLREEFGEATVSYETEKKNVIYIFDFDNAKILVYASKRGFLISLTLLSKLIDKYPVNCRLPFEDGDEILGNAKITEAIMKNCFKFESQNTNFGSQTIIGCYNSYRHTKHLKYFYKISGDYNEIVKTKDEIINQVCISIDDSEPFFFSPHDSFFL